MLPDFLKIPEDLKTHPELVKRDLILEYPLNIGSVYTTSRSNPRQWVIKVLNPANEEEAIIDCLQHDTSPRNHLMPCEIIRSADRTMLVMPYVHDIDRPMDLETRGRLMKLCTLLKVLHQIAEAIDHLHALRIAHIDLCLNNLMAAVDETKREHPQTTSGRVYIIDFDRSRQLALGPGHQPAIELPSTQYKHPLQMKSADPYSWDVYCMGKVFEKLTERTFRDVPGGSPWFLVKLSQWVLGKECGCTAICHCRPTAQRVLLAFTIVVWAVSLLEILQNAVAIIHALVVSVRFPVHTRS